MADSKSAEMEQLTDREIYHKQARAGNRIKQVMAALHMEMQGLDQKKVQLQRQHDHLAEALELLQFAPLNIGRRELPERTHSNHFGLCNEIELPMPEQTPVEMTFSTEAYSEFMGKGLHIDQWPESSVNQPMVILDTSSKLIPFKITNEHYDPQRMIGRDWFDSINFGASFPERVEGYWRKTPRIPEDVNNEDPLLPYPVVCATWGFDHKDFVARLKEVEVHTDTAHTKYRGITAHRWTGKSLGCGEFELEGWRWPDSLSVYLAEGVPPSRDFYQFIMQQHAHRWPERNTTDTALAVTVIGGLPKYKLPV